MEIERKYLVREIPPLADCRRLHMQQAYISVSPVIRVREIAEGEETQYVLTVKGPGFVVREEHELPLEPEEFEALMRKRDGRVIEKDRYLLPLTEELTAELDVFHGELEGLVTVEVEFADETAMQGFVPPAWFGTDVSNDIRYKNSYLSMGEIEEGMLS